MLLSQIEKDASVVCSIAAQEAGSLVSYDIPSNLAYYVKKYATLIDPSPLILIVAGQSNGVGTNEFVSSQKTVGNKEKLSEVYGSYLKGVHHRDYGSSIVWYGLPCAYKLLEYFPNKLIYVIGVGVSGAPITQRGITVPTYKTWHEGGANRQRAIDIINPILKSLPSYKMIGTLWLQGEAEALYLNTRPDDKIQYYMEDLRFSIRDIINWFLTIFGGNFFASTVAYWDYANPQQYNIESMDECVDIINQEYLNAINTIPNAYLASSINKTFKGNADLWRDYIHYSQKGYDLVGLEFAEFIKGFIS